MTIGELAARVGLRTSAIRYYEREGLLPPEGRTAGNYRFYGERAVDRLRFIRAAQASGLALGDVRALLDFRDGDLSPCDEVRRVIEARLAEVDQQLEQLRKIQRMLRRFRETCERTARGEDCPVLEQLGDPGRESPGS